MIQRYRTLFRAPGAAAFCCASFVQRMPVAMYPLGIILIIAARDGRYGFAGVLSALYLLGNAAGSPVLAGLADRHGQRRVLLPGAAVHAAGVATFAVLLSNDVPDWLLAVPVVVFGFSYVSVASLVRARWVFVLHGAPGLATALSLESVLDEVVWIVGPLVATVLVTDGASLFILAVGVVLVVTGSIGLASLRGTAPRPPPRDSAARASALRTRGMARITLATAGVGGVFASSEVAMVAFCAQHGQRALSGVVLALAAAGSAVAGLLYGAVDWRTDVLDRYRVHAVTFAVLPAMLFAAANVPALAVASFVLGLGTAPALITTFGLVQQIVPARSLTEGLAWANAGIKVGYAPGAALAGIVADQHGARAAFLVTVVASVFVALFALSVRVRRDPGPPSHHPLDGVVRVGQRRALG